MHSHHLCYFVLCPAQPVKAHDDGALLLFAPSFDVANIAVNGLATASDILSDHLRGKVRVGFANLARQVFRFA